MLLSTGTSAAAQSEYGKRIYDAYINGDMALWTKTIGGMESAPLKNNREKVELTGYYYGHTGYLIGLGEKETAKKYIEKAEKLIEEVLAEEPRNATALAYKGTFTGYRMSLNKMRTPILGPRTMKYIKAAYEADPENVQALTDMGNMFYYAPALFGGDKQEGMSYLERAIRKTEELDMTQENWNYMNTMVILAQYRRETGSPQKALELYEKILKIEPEFKWVRDELYPELKQELNNTQQHP